MIYFETERLVFRDWKAEDRVIFNQLNSDPIVMQYFEKPRTTLESETYADMIENRMNQNSYGLWAVENKKKGDFIGYIGFNQAVFEADFTPCIEIGWRLKKEAWGLGYATEGAAACLEYGFNQLHFDSVYSFTARLNQRSERVMKKIGLIKVKEFMHPNIDPANPLALHVLYCITKSEYFERHPKETGIKISITGE